MEPIKSNKADNNLTTTFYNTAATALNAADDKEHFEIDLKIGKNEYLPRRLLDR